MVTLVSKHILFLVFISLLDEVSRLDSEMYHEFRSPFIAAVFIGHVFIRVSSLELQRTFEGSDFEFNHFHSDSQIFIFASARRLACIISKKLAIQIKIEWILSELNINVLLCEF